MKFWRVKKATGEIVIIYARRYRVDDKNNLVFEGHEGEDMAYSQIETIHKHDWRSVTEWDESISKPKWRVEHDAAPDDEYDAELEAIKHYVDATVTKILSQED
jgi:hypothetical protein